METKYHSGNYKKYSNKNPFVRAVLSNFFTNMKQLLNGTNVNSVLDVGCGEGFVINFLGFNKVTGIDISEEALAVAKAKNPLSEFYRGNVYNIPFEEKSFDLVIASEVLEHLNDPKKAIKEIKRVTRRYCIFSVPNEPYFRAMNFLRGKNLTRLGNDIEHVQSWSSWEFVQLIEEDFDVVEVRMPFPWTMILCKKNIEGM